MPLLLFLVAAAALPPRAATATVFPLVKTAAADVAALKTALALTEARVAGTATTAPRFAGDVVTCYVDADSGAVVGLRWGNASSVLCSDAGLPHSFAVPPGARVSSVKVAAASNDTSGRTVGKLVFDVTNDDGTKVTHTCGWGGGIPLPAMLSLKPAAAASVTAGCVATGGRRRRLMSAALRLDATTLAVGTTAVDAPASPASATVGPAVVPAGTPVPTAPAAIQLVLYIVLTNPNSPVGQAIYRCVVAADGVTGQCTFTMVTGAPAFIVGAALQGNNVLVASSADLTGLWSCSRSTGACTQTTIPPPSPPPQNHGNVALITPSAALITSVNTSASICPVAGGQCFPVAWTAPGPFQMIAAATPAPGDASHVWVASYGRSNETAVWRCPTSSGACDVGPVTWPNVPDAVTGLWVDGSTMYMASLMNTTVLKCPLNAPGTACGLLTLANGPPAFSQTSPVGALGMVGAYE